MKFLFLFFLLNMFVALLFANNHDSITNILEEYIESVNPTLPVIDTYFEQNISDVSICKGPSNTYYLTGTNGDKYGVQEGIKVWASRNLIDWNLIGDNSGYVWTFDDDAVEWQKRISTRNGWKERGIIAPEMHYIKNNFWLTYTNSNSDSSGVLKSISGRAQGPYVEVKATKPFVKGGNASLFMDTDSTVYFIWDNGKIQILNNEMDRFTLLEPRYFKDETGNRVKLEGIHISKRDNIYILSGSKWGSTDNGIATNDEQNNIGSRYDGFIGTSNNFLGPYHFNSKSLPHAGGGHFFQDFKEQPWYVFSGIDVSNPMLSNAAFLPLKTSDNNIFTPKQQLPISFEKKQIIYVSRAGNNTNGNSWDNAFTSIQRAVDFALNGSQIWIAEGRYDAPVEINLRKGLYVYGGFKGDENELNERNSLVNKVIINGKNSVKNVVVIKSSDYVRLDGITIQGGNASGGSFFQQYGAGLHILGGGETIRLVNCTFENNKADQDGGGIYASIGAAPILINCVFKNNIAKNNGGAAAIYCNTANGYSTRFYNCTFDNNFSYGNGAVIYFNTNKKDFGLLTLTNCLLINNTTLGESGAICLDGNANLLMLNSTCCFNKGTSQGAVLGSLGRVPAKTRILNSIFYQNYGGILFSIEGEAEAVRTKEKIYYPNIWVQFHNCLFRNNEVSALVQRNFDRKKWFNVAEINESILGKDCIMSDPLFVDPINGDFHLSKSSSAKGKGSSKYFFKYDLNLTRRSTANVNIGCF